MLLCGRGELKGEAVRLDGEKIILSASDLMRFQGCAHAAALDRRRLLGEALEPADDDATAEMLQKKGDAHEAAYLSRLQETTPAVSVIPKEVGFNKAVDLTLEQLRAGAPQIFQGALRSGSWGGYADFLERVERPSRLGVFSYEVIDTKLKRSPDPKHLLQLSLYADLLAEVQGFLPERVHVVLGTNERVSFRTADYASYGRRLRRRLESFVQAPWPTRPEPVAACGLCPWRELCEGEWEATDSLFLVAGITRSQQAKLASAGITTIQQLAARTARVPNLAPETLTRLRTQARLREARRRGGLPAFELRAQEPGQGLGRLPEPNRGDLFFDMEGDPFFEGGLEYLFGVYHETGGKPVFRPVWAHDREAEGRATAEVIAFFEAHLRQHPNAYIYHYGQYEVTALKRLASRHGVAEEALDRLLRGQCFVDLYRAVHQGMAVSESGYSLKDLEVFYMPPREDAVATAGDSVVAYEAYRETADPAILEKIRAYNETDCQSTKGLRDWLVSSVRPKALPWFKAEKPEAQKQEPETDPHEVARAALHKSLASARAKMGEAPVDLLFELASFHRREDKPAWWAMFDRADRLPEELVDDLESLANLMAISPATQVKRSMVRAYAYPEQETKLREGSGARARGEGLKKVTIESLDPDRRVVEVKFGPSAGEPPEALDLIPEGPIGTDVLRAGVLRVASDVAKGGGRYRTIKGLLSRMPPRGTGLKAGMPILAPGEDIVAGVVRVASSLQSSCLPIQGPPGTGKTYVSAQAILALIRSGKRVAVSSNAHKAIDNLLLAVAARAREQNFALKAVKKVSGNDEGPADDLIETTNSNDADALDPYHLVGGTAWLFAREDFDQAFDYLFVDEAGQVSLANVVAMGTCAKNLVLVGDPMQLAQPVKGAHPGESGMSALEYCLAGHATAPEDRGIFLPVSRRMHPEVCRYISDIVYDGRLSSIPGAERQRILWQGTAPHSLPAAGIGFVEVVHEGNSQSSAQEAATIASVYRALLGSSFRDREGKVRRMTADDILVISPYNAQVNLLARHLPNARVGTVDRFQGQEAPACLVSMATSSGEEMPRDVAFLFSTNRLNVAVSRAQALAVVFASPALLDVACRTVDDMRLVNALCALSDYAARAQPS